MLNLKQTIFAFVLASALVTTAAAQDSSLDQQSIVTITAATAGERVRITAPASVVQLHVEVYAAGGEKLFDQEIRGGNVFDWHLQNGQGQRVTPGSYVCVVTAKNVDGKLTQRIGSVSVGEKSASVQPAAALQLSTAQAQTIGPLEENSSWIVSEKEEPETPTVIAHDGADGQMIRGRGALTFRIGNFFTGDDREQMRLTEEGNLGIGTSEPKTTLDVAGTIRAQRYLIVRPKSVDAGKSAQDYLTANETEPGESLASGSGMQDRIAKWIDNAGTLGDSAITEVGGLVGIGTTAPGSKLVVSSNSATLPPALGIARFADADGVQTAVFADSFGTNPIFNVRRANGTAASPSAVQANQLLGVIGASGYGASAYMGTRARVGFFASENWTNTANGSFITFNTTANGTATAGGTERLRIDSAGNVGIGATNPQGALQIGPLFDAAFKFDPSNGTPNAGYIRFGDNTGWKLHIGRSREASGGPLNAGTTGVLMTIQDEGKVGIGTDDPRTTLTVKGPTNNSGKITFEVLDSESDGQFWVTDNGGVFVRSLVLAPTTSHICRNTGYLAPCSSAAEYVPTVEHNSVYPEAGDLVSIAGVNPYGDDHAPFAVGRSIKPCDESLLGFLLKPELGADGNKLNDHYLPLAIFGYFPAKVTLENGAIKRGDPITSSSKPGYGMKATQACKIIGYALEDADQEGKIQIFAHLSEHTAPHVVALQEQLQQLQREMRTQLSRSKPD